MGQEAGEKGAGAVGLQPVIPKSDRLLAPGQPEESVLEPVGNSDQMRGGGSALRCFRCRGQAHREVLLRELHSNLDTPSDQTQEIVTGKNMQIDRYTEAAIFKTQHGAVSRTFEQPRMHDEDPPEELVS
jgi:hypothetical protein